MGTLTNTERAVTATIDLAGIVAALPTHPERPQPAMTALDAALLAQAERSAKGDESQPPRRELIAAALREADREQWWRDVAEAEVVRLRAQLTQAHAQVRDLKQQRDRLIAVVSELTEWAARRLGCLPSTTDVLARVRGESTRG